PGRSRWSSTRGSGRCARTCSPARSTTRPGSGFSITSPGSPPSWSPSASTPPRASWASSRPSRRTWSRARSGRWTSSSTSTRSWSRSSASPGWAEVACPSLQILLIPRHHPVQPVEEVLLLAQAVPLARVEDELGRHAVALQGAVELLALADRVGGVRLALEDQGGGPGVPDVGDGRALLETVQVLVGEAEEPLVVGRIPLGAELARQVREA